LAGVFELFKSVKKSKAAVPLVLRPALPAGHLTATEAWDDPSYLDAVSVMEGLEVIRREDHLDPDEDAERSDGDVDVEA